MHLILKLRTFCNQGKKFPIFKSKIWKCPFLPYGLADFKMIDIQAQYTYGGATIKVWSKNSDPHGPRFDTSYLDLLLRQTSFISRTNTIYKINYYLLELRSIFQTVPRFLNIRDRLSGHYNNYSDEIARFDSILQLFMHSFFQQFQAGF